MCLFNCEQYVCLSTSDWVIVEVTFIAAIKTQGTTGRNDFYNDIIIAPVKGKTGTVLTLTLEIGSWRQVACSRPTKNRSLLSN